MMVRFFFFSQCQSCSVNVQQHNNLDDGWGGEPLLYLLSCEPRRPNLVDGCPQVPSSNEMTDTHHVSQHFPCCFLIDRFLLVVGGMTCRKDGDLSPSSWILYVLFAWKYMSHICLSLWSNFSRLEPLKRQMLNNSREKADTRETTHHRKLVSKFWIVPLSFSRSSIFLQICLLFCRCHHHRRRRKDFGENKLKVESRQSQPYQR